MENIQMKTLQLTTFNKENKQHLELLNKLLKDDSIKQRFQGLLPNLMNQDHKDNILDKGFLITDNHIPVGYIDISKYNTEEKSVYLRCAIDKDLRGQSYGKRALKEVSNYIFNNYYQIERIILKIAIDNKASLKIAEDCGYNWLADDFYGLNNPNIKKRHM